MPFRNFLKKFFLKIFENSPSPPPDPPQCRPPKSVPPNQNPGYAHDPCKYIAICMYTVILLTDEKITNTQEFIQ